MRLVFYLDCKVMVILSFINISITRGPQVVATVAQAFVLHWKKSAIVIAVAGSSHTLLMGWSDGLSLSFGCVVIFISDVRAKKTCRRTTVVPGSLAFLLSFIFKLLILSFCGSESLTGVRLAPRKVKLLKRTETLKFQRGRAEEKERKVRKKKSVWWLHKWIRG